MFRFILALIIVIASLEGITVDDIPIVGYQNNRKGKGELALCAMFQNEAPFLKEWIEYHRLVGVDHFFLYNNLSSDGFFEVLSPYVDKGIVELFDVPFDSGKSNDGAKTHNFVQVRAYNDAIGRARRAYDWIAIIDADEFICPVVDETIPKALKRYQKADGVVVYWQIYGTSDVQDLEEGELLIEKLLWKMANPPDGLFKSIVKPGHATCVDPHWCKMSGKRHMVMPNGQRFTHHPVFNELPVDIIRINHYTYRTESYYYNVKRKRREKWGESFSEEVVRARLDQANSVYDPVMLKFVPKLKKNINIFKK